MFHRYTDPKSPLYSADGAARFGEVIDRAYDAMDEIVGDVTAHLPASSRLLVVSDHGFHAFDREVDLNAWLVREGFMRRRDAAGDGLDGVDWAHTRAYAVGIGSIDLNLRGREAQGIVAPGAEADALQAEIAARLRALRDPEGGATVVVRVESSAEAFPGPFAQQGPDLVVAFADGYRSSFANARGVTGAHVIEPNLHRWSGDHAASPAEDTPGILMANFPIAHGDPSLIDIAPTVLGLLGVPLPDGLDGKDLR
jgi:predicted AlkP superfamily phosphohydrolase/phosphomutase